MSFPSEQEHFDAVVAALTAANARPYDYDSLPASTVTSYTLVTVSDRFGGTPRMTAQIGTRGVRVTVRAVGITADNAREMRKRADAALREQRLAIDGFTSTPIQFETADPVAQDGDIKTTGTWYSGLSIYTYAI